MSLRSSSFIAILFLTLGAQAEEIVTTVPGTKPQSIWGSTTGNVAITTDYIDRGATQTEHGPAVQAGLDWNHPLGLTASVWGSNVYFPSETGTDSLQGDVSFGYLYQANEELSLGLSAMYTSYYPNHTSDMWEFPLTATWQNFTAGVAYAPRWSGVEGTGWYLIGEWSDNLVYDFRANLHVGYSLSSEEVGTQNYADFRIGIAREIIGVEAELSGSFVSLRQFDGLDDPRVVLTVSKTF